MTAAELNNIQQVNDSARAVGWHHHISEEEAEFIALHVNDMSWSQIAKTLHRDRSVVLRYIRKNSLSTKPMKGYNPSNMTDQDIDDYITKHPGMNARAIQGTLHVSSHRVTASKKRLGLSKKQQARKKRLVRLNDVEQALRNILHGILSVKLHDGYVELFNTELEAIEKSKENK